MTAFSLPLNGTQERTFWEKVAMTRWGSYVTQVEKHAILYALSLAGEPGRALEIGCDGGRWSKLLADEGWTMTCVDVNHETLQLCQRRLPGATCILAARGDETIPCGSGSLGLVLCIEVPPVIDSEWFAPEAHRVLTDHGLLIGVILNRASWRGLLYRLKPSKNLQAIGGFYNWSYLHWKRRLKSVGFDVIYEYGFCWPPFRRASNSRLVGPFTRIERSLALNRWVNCSPWIMFVARKAPHGTASSPDSARQSMLDLLEAR